MTHTDQNAPYEEGNHTFEHKESSVSPARPKYPQWTTLIWGIVFAATSFVLLQYFMQPESSLWSMFLLLDPEQWVFATMITFGAVILLLGLTAFARRRS